MSYTITIHTIPRAPSRAPAEFVIEVFQGRDAQFCLVVLAGGTKGMCVRSDPAGPRWFAHGELPNSDDGTRFTVVWNAPDDVIDAPRTLEFVVPHHFNPNAALCFDLHGFESWCDFPNQTVSRRVGSATIAQSRVGAAQQFYEAGSDDAPDDALAAVTSLAMVRCDAAPVFADMLIRFGAMTASGEAHAAFMELVGACEEYYRKTWYKELERFGNTMRPTCDKDTAHMMTPCMFNMRATSIVPGDIVGIMYRGAEDSDEATGHGVHLTLATVLTFEEKWLLRQFQVALMRRGVPELDPEQLTIADVVKACSIWVAARPYVPDLCYTSAGEKRPSDVRTSPFSQSASDCEDDNDAIARMFVYISEGATFTHPLLQWAQRLARQYVVFQCIGLAKNAFETDPNFFTHAYSMAVRMDVAMQWALTLPWKPNGSKSTQEFLQSLDSINPKAMPPVFFLEGTASLHQDTRIAPDPQVVDDFLGVFATLEEKQLAKFPVYFDIALQYCTAGPSYKHVMYHTCTRLMTNWYQTHGKWASTPPLGMQRLSFFFQGSEVGQFMADVMAKPESLRFAAGAKAETWVATGHAQALCRFERPIHVTLDEHLQHAREEFYLHFCTQYHHFRPQYHLAKRFTGQQITALRAGKCFLLFYRERVLARYEETGVYSLAEDCNEYVAILRQFLDKMHVRSVVVQRDVAHVLCFYCFF